MKGGAQLLRRQVLLISVLVVLFASALITYNLAFAVAEETRDLDLQASSLMSEIAGSIEQFVANNPAANLTSASDNHVVANRLNRIITTHTGVLQVSMMDRTGTKLFNSGTHAVEGAKTTPFSDFRNRIFLGKLRLLLSNRNNNLSFTRDIVYQDQSTVRVEAILSPAESRSRLWNVLIDNLLISLAAIAASLFVAISSARLLTAPLRALSTSISQIEEVHSFVSEPGNTAPKASDLIELMAGKIEQLGRQIAGDRTELREARGRLHQILSNLRESVLLVNKEGRVMLASPGVGEILGRNESSEGETIEEFAGPDHPLSLFVRLALASGETSAHATLPAMHDARSKSIATSVQLILDRGEIAGAMVSLHDRETLAKLETQLDYSERLANLARITSGIAHEVKNPLNAMVIHLELLKEKLARLGPDAVSALPQVEILTSEVQRLDRVVQTFLSFTKPVHLQLRPVDLNKLLEETLALVEGEAQIRNCEVEKCFQTEMPRILGDIDLLKQLFLNIAMNGIQSMENGVLKVTTHSRDGNFVNVEIADQGTGIDDIARDRIFQLYYTTKPDGHGIGLAQAYKAVQLHRGTISFSSKPSRGTVFSINIPVGTI